jgi:hypothetical protein
VLGFGEKRLEWIVDVDNGREMRAGIKIERRVTR